ncbi:MAG: peptide chain release factor 2 [Spirochaetales bacterium]|nr:peptide chain release factor 2 [Spirochaetales bacterium]
MAFTTISRKPGGIFDFDELREEVKKLEEETTNPDLWQDRERAEVILSKLKKKKTRLQRWESVRNEFQSLRELYELACDEQDESLEKEISHALNRIDKEYKSARIFEFLSDKHDDASTFLTIHSGAGGTEACDWVSMLFRMYIRWAERHGYKTEIIDILEAEGGIKSVLLEVSGEYAHGYLKTETGIHRLVRISPFDSNKRRHTSFASVFTTPVIDDDIEVDIRAEDLRIDTYRAAGAGGQHVNKTDSAVRITHIPTGIVAQCQNERSQHKNKSMALKVLKSRLYEHYMEEREKERAEKEQQKKDIAWGNQIRSYVFQPYTLVKDHRTKHETGNIQAVMDGEIDDFIEEYLKFMVSGQKV